MIKFTKKDTSLQGLDQLLPYYAVIEENCLLNKDGSLISGFYYTAPDSSNISKEELNNIANKINQATKLLGEGFTVYFDVLRTQSPYYPSPQDSHFPDKVSIEIDEERRRQFKQENFHFESKYILLVCYTKHQKHITKLENWLFGNKKDYINLNSILKNFKSNVNEFINLLSYSLKIQAMHHDETQDYIISGIANYIHQTLTNEEVNFNIPKPAIDLDIQIGNRDLILQDFIPKIGNQYVQCISIAKFPETAFPNILHSLDMLHISYRWSTRFTFLDKEKSEQLLKKFYNTWDEKVISWKDNLIQRAGLNPGRIDSHALDMAEDANIALNEARSDIVKYGHYTATIILMHENKQELVRQAEVVASLIQSSRGFNTKIETLNNIESFLGSLAGNLSYNVRKPIMHTLNLATLIHLSSTYSGEAYSPNPFLPANSPPLAYARTNGATPYRLNLHHKDVGHTLIVGRTGGGKSTLLSFILAQWLRYPKAKVFAFDKKESLYAITKSVGGIHYHLAKDNMTLCPLALVKENDTASLAWASEYIASLVDLQNIQLSALQKINIFETVKLISTQPNKSLSSFILAIGDSDISYALRCYTEDGALGTLLDGEANKIHINHFNTFELDSLLKMGEKNLAAVLGYLFYYIEQQLDGSPTIIALEEVWLVMMRSFFKAKFNEWLVTLRKQNCSVVFTCQNLGQLHKDIETLSAITDSTATKIFLPNPEANTKGTADIPGNYDLYIRFGLNDHEINHVVSKSTAKRDYYIKQENGSRLVQFDFGETVLKYCGISGTEEIANFKAQENQELLIV